MSATIKRATFSVSHLYSQVLVKYEETRLIARIPDSGRPTKITAEVKALVKAKMQEDDEITAIQFHALLVSQG